MTAGFTVDAIWARQAAAFLEQAGQPSGPILAEAGLDPALLAKERERIPYRQFASLLDCAAEATGDDCIGLTLASQPLDMREVGLLAYVGLSSSTLGDAIRN